MGWPYHFIDLSHEEKLIRRHLLDRYGSYAQLSAIVPVLVFQLYRLAIWVSSERKRAKPEYSAVPSSPTLKSVKHTGSRVFATKCRQLKWWLETDFARGCGSRGHWISAVLWSAWLLFLSVHKTGGDYLHLTKRVGIIAASQFPVLYMLNQKSAASPMAFAFGASHEELNPYHRMLGRIIYTGLALHTALYLNYFVQIGVLLKRLTHKDVSIGLVAMVLLTLLVTTALKKVRRFSYRVFFICHLFIGVAIMPLLFFHVSHLRLYVVEALALFVLDLIARKLDTVTAFTKITLVANTKLIKLSVPMAGPKLHRFKAAAGQHVYLNIPPESAATSIHQLLFNPFTVADVTSNSITIVLRVLHGPTTKALEHLTSLSKANPPIKIEGPYGSARRFRNLATDFDRILLIAGGVGSTFVLPIYRHIVNSLASEGLSSRKVQLVWSVRTKDETSWPDIGSEGNTLESDGNVSLFLTSKQDHLEEEGGVELRDVIDTGPGIQTCRPDIQKVVDETFRYGEQERVAIMVCGPDGMADEVRKYVSRWVGKGRHVWFHDESFGW